MSYGSFSWRLIFSGAPTGRLYYVADPLELSEMLAGYTQGQSATPPSVKFARRKRGGRSSRKIAISTASSYASSSSMDRISTAVRISFSSFVSKTMSRKIVKRTRKGQKKKKKTWSADERTQGGRPDGPVKRGVRCLEALLGLHALTGLLSVEPVSRFCCRTFFSDR